MSGTRSPSAEGRAEALADGLAPRTFQGRLTLAFVAVVAVTLGLVGLLVVNRLGAYFDQQQADDLARARGGRRAVRDRRRGGRELDPRRASGRVRRRRAGPDRRAGASKDSQQRFIAEQLAQADVHYRVGTVVDGAFVAAAGGVFSAEDEAEAQRDSSRSLLRATPSSSRTAPPRAVRGRGHARNPFTYRAAAIANVTGLLAIIGLIALAVAVVVAAALTRRIATPVRRLTEASRDLAEGDFARRVPSEVIEDGPVELSELGLQFNAMAERLQESVEIIRRDRDRSREFLADVSHELRTPIAALGRSMSC